MAFGLPAHLAPYRVNSALARACVTAAFGCLATSVLLALALQVSFPHLLLWPAAAALVPAMAMLWWLVRWRTLAAALGYLLVGGAAAFWHVAVLSAQLPALHGGSAVFATAIMALTLNAGPTRTMTSTIAWSLAGFVVGTGAVLGAARFAGHGPVIHPAPLLLLALLVTGLVFASVGRARAVAVRSRLHRALRDDRLAGLRVRLESEATALMHDTVLGDLIAVGHAEPGPLDPRLAAAIDRDLAHLLGEEWLVVRRSPAPTGPEPWQSTALFAAITEARELGIDVTVSGDVECVSRLDEQRSRALARTVKQCLVNVHRHAEAREAEVVVSALPDGVSVMVVDAGRGFDPVTAPPDRLGLRQSIIARIEQVGGEVRVWSAPGAGTSVLMRVPATAPAGSGGTT